MNIKSIAVFCASSEGNNPIYMETAYSVGKFLAQNNIRLIYGGAGVGCMGAVAKGALDHNGEVIGVLPHFLNKREIAHLGLTELIQVESMHERKLKMSDLADACISLPGGYGTMEELFEIITWGQLGLHKKPSALLNVNGFYDALIQQLKRMNEDGLLQSKYLAMLLVENDIEKLHQKITNYEAPELMEWLKKDNT